MNGQSEPQTHAVGVKASSRARHERVDVGVRVGGAGAAEGAGEFDGGAPGAGRVENGAKAGLVEAECRADPGQVVDQKTHPGRRQQGGRCGEIGGGALDLGEPAHVRHRPEQPVHPFLPEPAARRSRSG